LFGSAATNVELENVVTERLRAENQPIDLETRREVSTAWGLPASPFSITLALSVVVIVAQVVQVEDFSLQHKTRMLD